ncbi:redoxin [Bacterioplanes sanyensis]|uniref:Redoxin n=1 Tax=Bacterioplanes sanyensis TaxID=1249553 RepID=A0A222FKY1_9GAMM|nr:TlpA disulfide reductase family protein [Bacterioplanes sanyensis]ASP39419.1 redoxin [Bacterioplanes sanyensis]
MRYALLVLLMVISPAWAEQAAPDFTLPNLNGDGQVSLQQYRGKVVYVDFWASWCGPCRKSLPLLNELRNELQAQGFEVLAINLDDDAGDGLRFLERYPVDYPTLHDNNGDTPQRYGVRGMPTSYLIDRQGQLVAVHEGFKPSDMEKIRKKILDQL